MTITLHQPHTTDASTEGRRCARNAMRQRLWADDDFAHQYICHPERGCEDGCDDAPDPARATLYQSHIEAPPGTGWTTKGHGAL